MIKRGFQLVLVVALIAVSAPVYGAATGSVAGVVRDSAGRTQIGAQVQLLRPDLTVIASVYTNTAGHFIFPRVAAGRYAVKAMGTSFLPSLREDVRVHTSTIVNLTLNTLYEVVQWLPSEPRTGATEPDDWKWTLRSAANRPLLRWLEDGPLVMVSDGSGSAARLKARIMATGQQGAFGESGERVSATLEETPANSRELLAQVDFSPGSNAGLEAMLGFRQDLGFAGSVQSVAAVAIHPEIDAGDAPAPGFGQAFGEGPGHGPGRGLDEAAIRSSEEIRLGDELEAEVGSTQVLARFESDSPNTVLAALPFAKVTYRTGDSAVHYRMATAMPAEPGAEETQAHAWLPALSMRDGQLALERGLHQEIGWERRTGKSGVSVLVYADKIDNPVLEGALRDNSARPGAAFAGGQLLFDPASGLVRAAAAGFSTAGLVATAERTLPGNNQIRVTYANGGALVMAMQPQPIALAQLINAAHARRAQTCSLSLSGTLEGSGTHWRATYRWQPEATVTQVASYAENAADPYLNVQLRQPIHLRRDGTGGFEAMVSLRNLLAQGYQPYVLSDGSVLVLAEAQRGVSGGVVFSF